MVDAALLRARIEVQNAAQASQQLAGFGRQIDQTGSRARDAQGRFTGLNQGLEQSGRSATTAGRGFQDVKAGIQQLSPIALGTTGAVVALGVAAKQSVDASIQWESALAGVSKTLDTTGLSAEEAQQAVADIGTELRQMAQQIPISAVELAGVAEAAGQLGVAREEVVSFTETMALLGVATNLSADEAATAIARIQNITGLAASEVDNFGSALVSLGNNSAATESQILEFTNRLAAAGTNAGLTEGEILGLSAALASVGINAEAGSTALIQVMNEITTSVATADDRLATFAQLAGHSAADFAAAWRSDPSLALADFIEGLREFQRAGGDSVLVLDELELDGIRVSLALNSLANAGDLTRDSMARGNDEMKSTNALNEEAARRFETTASQVELAKNRMNEASIVLGDQLTPAYVEFLNAAAAGTSVLADTTLAIEDLGSAAISVDWGGLADGAAAFGYAMSGLGPTSKAGADAATEAGTAFADLGALVQAVWGDVVSDIEAQQISDALAAQVPQYTTQLDVLRTIGQQAFIGLREDWEQQFAAMGEAVALVPESAADYIDDLVEQFRAGQATIGQVWSIIGTMPQSELIPALQDVRTEWLTTVAEFEDADAVREATQNLVAMDEILAALGIRLDTVQSNIGNWGDVQSIFQQNIDMASAKVNEWSGNLSGAEAALKILQDRQEAGKSLSDEQLEALDTLTWATERYSGGVEDNEDALIDAEVAKANYIRTQDQVNAALEANNLTQEQANELLDEARQQLDPTTRMTEENRLAQEDLASALDALGESLREILVELGILDDTSAEAEADVDTEPASMSLSDMEENLEDYESSTYTTSLDADASAAEAEINRIRALATSPAYLPVNLQFNGAGGGTASGGGNYASGTPSGGVPHDQLALVGEEGPELAWLPRGTHILPADETERMLQIFGPGSVPGFADGTGSLGINTPPPTTAGAAGSGGGSINAGAAGDFREQFVDVGVQIADAITFGIDKGLIESGVPTGEQYAAAIIDGATHQIDTDGDEVLDSWAVVQERIPELAADIGQETVLALLEQYAKLQGELELAMLSGADTSEIDAQLAALFAIFAEWSGNSVEEVEAVWDALLDEQRAADVQARWEDILNSIQMPGPTLSFDLDDLLSGDAQEQLQQAGEELWDLFDLYSAAGMTDAANAVLEQIAALDLQDQFVDEILGTDTGQQLMDEFAAQVEAAEAEEAAKAAAEKAQAVQDRIWDTIMAVPIEELANGEFIEEQQKVLEDLYDDLSIAEALGLEDKVAEIEQAISEQEDLLAAAGEALATPMVEEFAAGMSELDVISMQTLDELTRIFSLYPEVAKDMIDEVIGAVADGHIPFAEAMKLLAMVPEDDLIPALERLEETLTVDLAEALLEFGEGSPEVQAILQALQAIEAAANATDDAISQIPDSLANLPGSKGYQAPGDQSPGGSPESSTGDDGKARFEQGVSSNLLDDLLSAVAAQGMVTVREGYAGMRGSTFRSFFRELKDDLGAATYRDADGLLNPSSGGGFTLYGNAGDYYVNPFADGGIVTDRMLALVGDNPSGTEAIVPLERAGELGFGGLDDATINKLARALGDELRKAPITNLLDGREIAGGMFDQLNSAAISGQVMRR